MLDINSFIITLGTMSVIRGLAYIIIGGNPLPFEQPIVRYIGRDTFLGVPIPIYFMAVVLVLPVGDTVRGQLLEPTSRAEAMSLILGT